ncbi:hypothetical protein FQR65_LT00799 [Abscondita terminalis]|nr:hypothetical protein FQR65_LT00799 [Abscondita terminalis]
MSLFQKTEQHLNNIDEQDIKHHLEGNSSMESSGPPDSHEAMNNRDLSSKQSKSNREKRSYEFLMGLVNNNSKFEVTNVDLPTPNDRKKDQISKNQALLELMIKIASDPEQWEKVHRLLQNATKINVPKKDDNELKKMVVILNDKKQKPSVTHLDEALKSNRWPDFQSEGKVVYKPNNDNTKYNWQQEINTESKTYPRNFAYHRVTGNPLYHSNFDKNPKAYIAVSVIAPKPLHSRSQEEDLILENELRQLKPWTTKQSYDRPGGINPRWIMPTENNKNTNAP